MRAVAERAGVSVKTVEAAFATKANLLKELIDVRIAGDDEPVAISDRPAVAEMIAEPDPDRLLELNAVFVADISRRIVVVDRVARRGAPPSPELADLLQTSLDNRAGSAPGCSWRSSPRRRPCASRPNAAIDTVWLLLDPHLYDLFTTERGWTHEPVRGLAGGRPAPSPPALTR